MNAASSGPVPAVAGESTAMSGRSSERKRDVAGESWGVLWVLRNDVRAAIVLEVTRGGTLSPGGFVKQTHGEISGVSRHFKQLADRGHIELVEERSGPGRGGRAHIYRSTAKGRIAAGVVQAVVALDQLERSADGRRT